MLFMPLFNCHFQQIEATANERKKKTETTITTSTIGGCVAAGWFQFASHLYICLNLFEIIISTYKLCLHEHKICAAKYFGIFVMWKAEPKREKE